MADKDMQANHIRKTTCNIEDYITYTGLKFDDDGTAACCSRALPTGRYASRMKQRLDCACLFLKKRLTVQCSR